MFQLEREANQIAKQTRRGKGNIVICSSDVASALQMAGVLDYAPALNSNSLQVDDTGNTFAGVLNGRLKVYIDPYAIGGNYDVAKYSGIKVIPIKWTAFVISAMTATKISSPHTRWVTTRSMRSESVSPGGAVSRIAASRMKELVITDSIQPTQAVKLARNIRVMSIAPLLGEAIGRTATESSVSSLFD